jgi:hypothetical protein
MDKPNPNDFNLTTDELITIYNRINASPLNGNDFGLLLAAFIFLPTLIVPLACLSQINWNRLLPVSKTKIQDYLKYQEAEKRWIDWQYKQ